MEGSVCEEGKKMEVDDDLDSKKKIDFQADAEDRRRQRFTSGICYRSLKQSVTLSLDQDSMCQCL